MRDRDSDGFMKLIPASKTKHLTQRSVHSEDYHNTVEYWKERCLRAEERIERLEKDISDYGEMVDMLNDMVDSMSEDSKSTEVEEDLPSAHDVARFNYGLGLSFGPGKESTLYRLSDGTNLKDAPKEKFAGGEIEVQPGRGFKINLHWRKK